MSVADNNQSQDPMYRVAIFLLGLLLHTISLQADVLVLKEGQVLFGTVHPESPAGFKYQLGATNFTYPSDKVSLVSRKPARTEPDGEIGLPSWGSVLERVGAQTWGSSLKQIPATVIDEGVFRSVPYLSFRCGVDYEVNRLYA
ncbi:MAG: hypothetical protein ABMA26_10020 [Limisphaerales bacterium]